MKKRRHIMIVDDEPEIRRLLKRTLELEGYGVTSADNGSSALATIKECQPDLVMLDIVMPGLNGFQVLNLIREHSDVPIIMLTGRCEVTSLRDALVLGADDYIRKPFHTKELLARIQAKLRRAAPEVMLS